MGASVVHVSACKDWDPPLKAFVIDSAGVDYNFEMTKNFTYTSSINGTVVQYGGCTEHPQQPDGGCLWECDANGAGIPPHTPLMIRGYYNPHFGGMDMCYNIGPGVELPKACNDDSSTGFAFYKRTG